MDNDAKKYRDSQRIDLYSVRSSDRSRTGDIEHLNNRMENESASRRSVKNASRSKRYTSKKSVRNMKRNIKIGLATALLAAGIGVGTISFAGVFTDRDSNTITQMQENGMDLSKLGLADDTLETMERYDEYFENFDKDSANLTENEVIDMIKDIKELNFDVIMDKIAQENGKERQDVKLHYSFENGDGHYHTSIVIDEGSDDEISYSNTDTLFFGIGRENYIPEKLSDLIIQIGEYKDLINDVQEDNISKVNAVKKLNKLYDNISEVATSELSIDEKGNISLLHAEDEKEVEQKKEEQKKTQSNERDEER